jgi:hypothetical protein
MARMRLFKLRRSPENGEGALSEGVEVVGMGNQE